MSAVSTIERPSAAEPELAAPDRETRVLLWCNACIPVTLILLFGGMLVAGIVPPPAAHLSPEETVAFWTSDQDLKLMFIVNFSAAALQGIAIAVAVFMHEEGSEVLPRWLGYFNCWMLVKGSNPFGRATYPGGRPGGGGLQKTR